MNKPGPFARALAAGLKSLIEDSEETVKAVKTYVTQADKKADEFLSALKKSAQELEEISNEGKEKTDGKKA